MTVETVSDVAAAQVRRWRKQRGLQVADLAARCKELGSGQLTENVIENIESGRRAGGKRRRDITVDELLNLAVALNVAPVHLLVPVDDQTAAYPIVGGVLARRLGVRAWIRGVGPIDPDADPREFHSAVPRGEFYWPASETQGAVQQGAPLTPAESERLTGPIETEGDGA
jgi:transcriptional regulator with XRE-family HTH domain